MLTIVKTCALLGLEGKIVRVEVDVSNGLPAFAIVGLPDTAVKEATERVRAAIKNSGFEFPTKRITVNLAPADIKKEGSAYDLPIAIGILGATGQIDMHSLEEYVFLSELSLGGSLRHINGILPSVMAVKLNGFKKIIVPYANRDEAALVKGIEVYPFKEFKEIIRFLKNEVNIECYNVSIKSLWQKKKKNSTPDFADVKGQYAAKRALEIAAAGGHNILMIGSPGSGKTMLARRLPGILPDMSIEEALETTKIYSVAGLLKENEPLITERPFRSPHHNASSVSLIGGGRIPKPGEISLSTHGVLFLDELPEFHKNALEALRQPIEDGIVTISRITAALTYPARLILVAAMNPCPCGYYGDSFKECTCTPYQVERYAGRISGPLMDRIDLHIEVPKVKYQELSSGKQEESSAQIKVRVEKARKIQSLRYKGIGISCNAQMERKNILKYCRISKEANILMQKAFDRLNISARSHDRILKVARTIADLEGSKNIEVNHLTEAIQYRNLDRKKF